MNSSKFLKLNWFLAHFSRWVFYHLAWQQFIRMAGWLELCLVHLKFFFGDGLMDPFL